MKKAQEFTECPYCGSPNIEIIDKWWYCNDCGEEWNLNGLRTFQEIKKKGVEK